MERLYEDVKQMVNKEIETITAKPELSASDLECLGELIDIIKDIEMMNTDNSTPKGYSGGTMPYYGVIGYDEPWKRDSRVSYGRSNMARYNDNGNGSSYGRYDERMMPPNRDNWM